jgi:REP element-mobilizing transposase RayT
MPRRARTLATGEYYHLYNRGNNRQAIFFERENYLYFLRQFRYFVAAETADVVAYCLMPNHYHLLVYLCEDGLSKAMQRFTMFVHQCDESALQTLWGVVSGAIQYHPCR